MVERPPKKAGHESTNLLQPSLTFSNLLQPSPTFSDSLDHLRTDPAGTREPPPGDPGTPGNRTKQPFVEYVKTYHMLLLPRHVFIRNITPKDAPETAAFPK